MGPHLAKDEDARGSHASRCPRRVPRLRAHFESQAGVSADLSNPDFARQAINYSYNKSVTWAALTNFDSLRIYNAEWYGPNPNFGLFLDLQWEQYERDFDRLWWLSNESMQSGILDREAAKVGKKLKKTPVGEQLFGDMWTFRGVLRDYFRAYNEAVAPDRLEHAVQRLLDRLIFIRALEDAGSSRTTSGP